MNYYLMFEKFESKEVMFSVQEPWRGVLVYYHPQYKVLKKRAIAKVTDGYRGAYMSDFLKLGEGMLASRRVQQVFFEHGFTGFQFIPVDLENNTVNSEYAFINVIADYDFLDPFASKAEEFSHVLGGYKRVFDEVVDREMFNNSSIQHDCFTFSTFKLPYYVNESVKEALEEIDVKGIEFIPMEFS
jgi:hypothetical protein